MRGGRVKGR
jgi:hypothetical protein